ncbi:unnamed protein product [Miscanthus lutarioriparius]|uniref:Uncharacterized protein n=1 Tax=Miscanthus lutarioriparius TaxID=422564 RepID=A0A811NA43_9POAL|nr:unnamed protein product [Miscanthus lutarioriparius]
MGAQESVRDAGRSGCRGELLQCRRGSVEGLGGVEGLGRAEGESFSVSSHPSRHPRLSESVVQGAVVVVARSSRASRIRSASSVVVASPRLRAGHGSSWTEAQQRSTEGNPPRHDGLGAGH